MYTYVYINASLDVLSSTLLSYEVLFEDVPVSKSVRTLMERDKKAE